MVCISIFPKLSSILFPFTRSSAINCLQESGLPSSMAWTYLEPCLGCDIHSCSRTIFLISNIEQCIALYNYAVNFESLPFYSLNCIFLLKPDPFSYLLISSACYRVTIAGSALERKEGSLRLSWWVRARIGVICLKWTFLNC